jgi:hypothetical protein
MSRPILWAAMALVLAVPGGAPLAQSAYTPSESQQPPAIVVPAMPPRAPQPPTIIAPPTASPTLPPPAGLYRPPPPVPPAGSVNPGTPPCQGMQPSGVTPGAPCK